jgi:hypothetical protein
MAPNDSKHLLPMNSVLFSNNPSSHPATAHHLANPTLANLQDAQDTSVTALPQPPTTTTINAKAKKTGFWKTALAKIKNLLHLEKKRKEEKKLCIGEPFGFRHIETWGARPLLGATPVVVDEVESEWEDTE